MSRVFVIFIRLVFFRRGYANVDCDLYYNGRRLFLRIESHLHISVLSCLIKYVLEIFKCLALKSHLKTIITVN